MIGGFAVGRMARDPPALIEQTALELKAIELGWGNDNPAFRRIHHLAADLRTRRPTRRARSTN